MSTQPPTTAPPTSGTSEPWPYWQIIKVRDLVRLDIPGPKWLVDQLVPGDGWTLMLGEPKAGKSILTAQLMRSLFEGSPFLGYEAQKTRVLYVQTDAPPKVWQQQLTLLEPEGEWETVRTPKGSLTRPTRDKFKLLVARFNPGLIVFDALEHFTGPLNLNEEAGAKMIAAGFKEVASGVPFILVHHPHKPKPGFTERAVTKSAGHHYLAGDASATLDLVLTEDGQGATLHSVNRLAEPLKIRLKRGTREQGGAWSVRPERAASSPSSRPSAPSPSAASSLYDWPVQPLSD